MIYLDNGATTFPKPISVITAVNRAMREYGANPGRSGHDMSVKASEKIYKCREKISKLFHTDNPEKIIFTSNCTTALNTVIHGILREGDHVIISSLEHNSVLRPLEELSKKGITYSVAEVVACDDEATINNFRNSIKSNTKLVVCTHASNVFGIKLPVEKIGALCRIYGILFCVDAAQTAGTVNIDLSNSYIDFLCTSGHKGLYGPMGTGLLVINSDTLPDTLIQGGTGSMSLEKQQPHILPDMYESGTPNLIGIVGLSEGVDFVLKQKPEHLYKNEMNMIIYAYDKLKNLNNVILYTERPDILHYVPVLSFNIKNLESEQTAQILNNKYKIAVRAGYHCSPLAHKNMNTDKSGTVRIVISAFTTPKDINYFINAVSSIKS